MAEKKKTKINQRTEALKYMKSHRCITDEIGHEKFGINRMGSVIYDLRKAGHIIKTVMVTTKNRYGNTCRYGKYYYVGQEGE